MKEKGNFELGSVKGHVISLAIPIFTANVVQMLYNIVDRIYIGHLPGASTAALTGLGLTFPVITVVTAFTRLFGMGGAPLFAIARGEHDRGKAERILGCTAFMLFSTAFFIMLLCYIFMTPLLNLIGASEVTMPYARAYLRLYLIGTPFVMLSSGLNSFITAQGFGRTGMLSVVLGAVTNMILDPLFIFVFNMGIQGAAIATVISQCISAAWVMSFLTGKKPPLRIRMQNFRADFSIVRRMLGLGTAGFVMAATNGISQTVANNMLSIFGGDIYIGIMTVATSLRDVFILLPHGITDAAQPVIGYNYGACRYDRVKECIRFITASSLTIICILWALVFFFPKSCISVFNNDPELLEKGVSAIRIFFSGYFMMSFQGAGQSTYVGLGMGKHATFFAIFRKIVIVVPLTLILPYLWGLGVNGVFLAEAVSNVVGGTVCYITMLFAVKKKLSKPPEKA